MPCWRHWWNDLCVIILMIHLLYGMLQMCVIILRVLVYPCLLSLSVILVCYPCLLSLSVILVCYLAVCSEFDPRYWLWAAGVLIMDRVRPPISFQIWQLNCYPRCFNYILWDIVDLFEQHFSGLCELSCVFPIVCRSHIWGVSRKPGFVFTVHITYQTW